MNDTYPPVDHSRAEARWAEVRDLGLLLYLTLAVAIAWFVPERSWDGCCHVAALARARVRARWCTGKAKLVATLLDRGITAEQARALVVELTANRHRARLQILRGHRRPAWEPRLELVGVERVREALEAGRSVVLWLAPFIFDSLLAKMAFHRAGLPLVHLSRRGHGFSTTRLGSRFLNPVWTTIEDRYLRERLTMSPGNYTRALRTLVDRVRHRQLVSVTVGKRSQQNYAVPFLAGTLPISDAVPGLAVRTGAVVLPVFTVREADGRFVVTVEAPFSARPDDARGAVPQILEQLGERLESWVRRYPGQFNLWEDAVVLRGAGAVD